MSLAVDTLESKAVISAASLPTGSKVGVHLVDATSTGLYNGHDYSNVLYTMSSGKLTSDQEVMLTPTSGTVYAYYPYVADGDIASLPINILSQTDYMWATPRSGMSFDKNSTTLAMRHVLAVASFQIVKGNYSGASKVTAVSMKGSHLHTTATYSGKNGTISSRAGASKQIACVEGGFTLNTTGSIRNILLLPSTGIGTATVTITLDGYNRTVSIPDFKPEAGKRYRYVLTVNDSEIVVSNVSVDFWTENNSQYNVYFTGDTKDIAINQEVEEDGTSWNIIINASGKYPGYKVNDDITVSGECKYKVSYDLRGAVISLTDVLSDIHISFSGVEYRWCEATYYHNGTYVSILGNCECGDNNVEDDVSIHLKDTVFYSLSASSSPSSGVYNDRIDWENPMLTLKFILPLKAKGNLARSFSTYNCSECETVAGAFSYNDDISSFNTGNLTSISSYMFAYSDLFTLYLSGSVDYIGGHAFFNSKLQDIVFTESESLKLGSIHDYAFAETNIDNFDFMSCSNLKEIHGNAFYSSQLSEVKIPSNVETIGIKAFAYCSELENVEINSECELGCQAFYECNSLKKVRLNSSSLYGSTTYELFDPDRGVFMGCDSLKVVIFDNSITLNSFAFYDCPSLTDIYIDTESENTVTLGTLRNTGNGNVYNVVFNEDSVINIHVGQNCPEELVTDWLERYPNHEFIYDYWGQDIVLD